MIAVAEFTIGIGAPTYTIPQITVKQSVKPHRLMGRMNPTMNTFAWGTMALGPRQEACSG